jgi:DeoR/GlpR family transcriptional regulator of sugar metabolism
MLASGRRSVLALDASKFSHAAMAVVTAAADFDVVVTDRGAPPAAVDALEAAGVAVHRV